MNRFSRSLALTLCCAAVTAGAEERSPVSVGIWSGVSMALSPADVSDNFGSGTAFGARFRYEVSDRWSVGGQFLQSAFPAKGAGSGDLIWQSAGFLVQRRFFDDRTWIPYLHALLGINRAKHAVSSNERISSGLLTGLGAGVQWNFHPLMALQLDGGVRRLANGSPRGDTAQGVDVGLLFVAYLPDSWVPLVAKEELSFEELSAPLSTSGPIDELLLTQGELNEVLQKIEDGRVPPILFEAGNAIMLTSSYEALDNIGAVLRKHVNITVRVYGFIEEEFTGGTLRAETLALTRADAVRTYLIDSFRLTPDKLMAAGLPPLPVPVEGEDPPALPLHITFEVVH